MGTSRLSSLGVLILLAERVGAEYRTLFAKSKFPNLTIGYPICTFELR